MWRYLRPALAPRRVLHGHYRGHGRSQAPRHPERVEIEDLADDAAAVLDDAEVGSAVWIGHSMGVQVALEAWRRHRDRVAALVLVCGAPGHPLRTFHGADTLEHLLPTIERWVLKVPGIVNALTRRLLPTRLALEVAGRLEINRDLVEPEDFMPYLEGMARMDVRTFIAMLAAAGRHTTEDFLDDIDVPVLVVAGARDGFTPAARSEDMIARIPACEGLVIEDGSHTAPIERPERVNEAITSFMERHVGAPNA
ncbi:MAG: alpha/beta hydrolase [Myxococcales bacterium]|nr:alpha/beta hydrolase [Myxococcales bacterium]